MGDKPRCRRCSSCDINYPTDVNECRVEGCGNETWEHSDEFDTDWKKQVMLIENRKRMESGGPIPNVEASPIHHDGFDWIAETVLIQAGYDPTDGSVVLIAGEFFELAGRKDGAIPAWMLEHIEWHDQWPEDLPVLSLKEYEELEKSRQK